MGTHAGQSKCAVLVLLFKRERVAEIIQPLRRFRPERIYLSADGPRAERAGESGEVEAVRREWFREVDWPCLVRVRFADGNQGCRKAVSGGIDWFFEHEVEGIIVEEDCLVSDSFLPFAAELLNHYRDDQRVMSITAQNEQCGLRRSPESYYFSEIAHCWGWASWRRAWSHFREVEARLPHLLEDRAVFQSSSYPLARTSWPRWCRRVLSGELDSWAIIWSVAHLAQRGLSVIPNVNLVTNLGFDAGATHTPKASARAFAERSEMDFPLAHPALVHAHTEADAFDYRHCYGWCRDRPRVVKGWIKRLVRLGFGGFGRIATSRVAIAGSRR